MIPAFRKGITLLPAAFRRRDLLVRWIGSAHRTQFVLVLTAALTIFSLPPLLDWALPKLYPPVRTKVSLLGIPALSTSRPDPRVAERREQILVVAWALWLAAAAFLLISDLPAAAAKAGAGESNRERRPKDPRTGAAGLEAATRPDAGRMPVEATVIESAEPASPAVRTDSRPARPSVPGAEPAATEATLHEPHTTRPGDSAEIVRMGPANRYQLTRELGRGGMGVVYQAMDTVLQREVALKELPLHMGARSELAQRFRQEARVLARLSHPYIVQVHDLIEDEGRLWIALEYVRGGTLTEAMRWRGGAFAWGEAAKLGRQIAEGLGFAHAQGVIHRDIKPMNVLLTDTDPPVAKLTDFGLARLIESTEHTQPGSILGSARYMSPEQVAGRPADARSDLYALGVTYFEMLTGQVPFDGEFAAVLARHANEVPPDVRTLTPEVPEAFAALVAALLAKAPEQRPADAADVVRALESLSDGGGEARLAA